MTEEKKEEIRKILLDHIDEIGNKFDDFLCYQKYGKETFLAKGFQPTEEDYKIRKVYEAEEFSVAAQKIKEMGKEILPILEDLSQNESDLVIKDWASIILQDMRKE